MTRNEVLWPAKVASTEAETVEMSRQEARDIVGIFDNSPVAHAADLQEALDDAQGKARTHGFAYLLIRIDG